MTAQAAARPNPRRVAPDTILLGALALALVGAAVTGASLPLISSDRAALIALTVVAVAMCARGPLGILAARGAWLSWAFVLGVVLGVLGLAVVASVFLGTPIPVLDTVVATDRAAFLALAGVVLAKVTVGVLYRLTTRAS